MRDNRIIRSRHLHKLQRRHFIFFDVLPFLAWNVKVPSREKIALRLARQETHEALDLERG